jgi:hypothetical protein
LFFGVGSVVADAAGAVVVGAVGVVGVVEEEEEEEEERNDNEESEEEVANVAEEDEPRNDSEEAGIIGRPFWGFVAGAVTSFGSSSKDGAYAPMSHWHAPAMGICSSMTSAECALATSTTLPA